MYSKAEKERIEKLKRSPAYLRAYEDVAFLHPVLLALQAHAPCFARTGLAPVADEVVEGDGFGADEALLEVGMDDGCRLRRGR